MSFIYKTMCFSCRQVVEIEVEQEGLQELQCPICKVWMERIPTKNSKEFEITGPIKMQKTVGGGLPL